MPARMTSTPKPVALVTGSSRGIGAAVAEALASDGFPVLLHARAQTEKAEAVAARIRAAGGIAAVAVGDLRDAAVPGALVAEARKLGPVGVLVNNATPAMVLKPVSQIAWDDVQAFLEVFVRAPLLLAQAAKPDMAKAKWGRIVNVATASLWDVPPAGFGAYAAAKHALLGFTKSIAAEWGPEGITANSVSPGLVATELTAFIPAAFKQASAQQTPLRRLAEPADVAQMVRFLCSPGAAFVTGAHLPVTGGWRMP